MDGYRLPPIMFTEEEANALIFGENDSKNQRRINLLKF